MKKLAMKAGVILGLFLSAGSTLMASQKSPTNNSIVINEIMQNPDAVTDMNGEWFELYNNSLDATDINGWTIMDLGVDSHIIDNGGPLIIPPEGYVVLGRNANAEENGGVWVDYEYDGFNLGNADDGIILLDGDGIEVDQVVYDGGLEFPDPTGASMELDSPELDNSVGANWQTASTPYGDGDFGTPGARNSVPLTIRIVINEIMQNPDAVTDANGEWFELYNNSLDATDINGWTIMDLGVDSHIIDNGGPLIIPPEGYVVLGRNANAEENGGVWVDYEYDGFNLGNADDGIILLDGDGIEVDQVVYDGGLEFPDPTGASMELDSPELDNNVGANWQTASTPYGDGDFGTPGVLNSQVIERGDVNSDGQINVLDVLAVVNHILDIVLLDEDGQWRADCNGDGNINVLDALGIVNVILGIAECEP